MAKKANKRSKHYNEDVELDTTYRRTVGKYEKLPPKKAKKRGNGFVIAICILIPVLLLGAAACYFLIPDIGNLFSNSSLLEGITDNGLILENVTIVGVNVGGMTKDDAIAAVKSALSETLLKEPMTVTVLDREITLSPEMTQVTLDVEAAVDIAYGFGRTGSSVQRKEEKLLAATTGLSADIADLLSINETAVAAQLDALQIEPSGTLTQSTWEIIGELPDLHAAEAPTELQTLIITKGTPGYQYDQQALIQQILKAYQDGVNQVVCNCETTEPDPLDLDAIFMNHCTVAIDAQMDPETFEIIPHTYGHQFDLLAAQQALAEADYGEKMEFPFTISAPAVFETDLSSQLFKDTLASYTSYQASSDSRATNMQIACKAIDGTILLPGEVFDFNNTVGERTAAKGYQPAPSYSGGKTVLTYGGGICQPSSTIYYCALLADLEIVERDCHSYPSSYVPYGMDATVNWGTLNFKFRNNTQYPLRIDASADNRGNVSISLVGTDTKDYYVKMEYEIVGGTEPKDKIIEMTQAEATSKGYRDGQTITSPLWGYRVQTYKLKFSKADDSLLERTKEAYSVYTQRDKEIVKITDIKEEPTEPPATEPPATEPPATEPPATEPPATEPPATEPPATEPPATEPPATEPPAVEPPSE